MRLTSSNAWKALEHHAYTCHFNKRNDSTAERKQEFTTQTCGIFLDYSNQFINQETLSLLFELADSRSLSSKINGLLQGDIVNKSENRPALHTALRAPANHQIMVHGKDIIPEIIKTRETIHYISEQIRNKKWLGFTGEPVKDIVNIGIGGSDLGPRFCVNALTDYISPHLNLHFISDADPTHFQRVVKHLKPETTLFIISSKSYNTEETLYNAKKACKWLGKANRIEQQVIAITADRKKAMNYGIKIILPIWDWVGGRYSSCSAINLITAIGIGYEQFNKFLEGAHDMDNHFLKADFAQNSPVLLALLGIWNNNFLDINNLLFLVYAKNLELFVQHIQQLDMESNGKSIDCLGQPVNYKTGPIVWGGLGNQAQHSYFQLLSQGTHRVSTDFISLKQNNGEIINDLCHLKINLLAKSGGHLDPLFTPGCMTINHLQLDSCSPYTIGAFVALYEHKIFAQSVIWDINPFDQPGVASTKRILEYTI